MTQARVYKNAVLDDLELQNGLTQINPKFGDFVNRVAGEAWGLPLIDQKTKALITIAIDVVNQDHRGPGNPFAAHVKMEWLSSKVQPSQKLKNYYCSSVFMQDLIKSQLALLPSI